jgi:hypothetical protein
MIPIAFLNGTLRQFVYGPRVGEPAAHQISCITAIIAFGLLIFAMTRRWHFDSFRQAWRVGALWAAATVAFETTLGRLGGLSWSDLFLDYDLWNGHLWALVVSFIAIAPALIVLWDRAHPTSRT